MKPYKYCTTCGHTWPEDCGCGETHARPVIEVSEAEGWLESLLDAPKDIPQSIKYQWGEAANGNAIFNAVRAGRNAERERIRRAIAEELRK